jgi:predicted amidophosphoribosyltransferase
MAGPLAPLFLLPQRCAICALPGAALCDGCTRALVRLTAPVCDRCGSPGAWPVRRCPECAGRRLGYSTARAAIVYDDSARAFVRAWKERGRRDLSRLAADLVAAALPRPPGDALTFVPGERDRVLRRGHAPPERLAWELGRRWGLPVRPLLVRSRHVPRQRGLSLASRRSNVEGAFESLARVPAGLVLVDDVYASGSTVSACARALKGAGAERVDVVCLARAVR